MERITALLRIAHRQHADGEELSGGEQRALGQLSRAGDDGWLLRYAEPAAEDEAQGAQVELALLEGEVRMRRGGDTPSQARFQAGRPCVMRYEVMGRSLELRIFPSRVHWEIGAVRGHIALEYTLQVGAQGALEHCLRVEVERLMAGAALREQARELLTWQGETVGFLRWADGGDALLISDAGRAAPRRGIAPEALARRVREAGWALREAEGLWWLDPPEVVYRQALCERPALDEAGADAAWRDGELGALQAACAALLFRPVMARERPIDDALRALLRGAWRGLEGDAAQVMDWVRTLSAEWAWRQRAGDHAGQSACGALLWAYLRRQGVGVPPEALAAHQSAQRERGEGTL